MSLNHDTNARVCVIGAGPSGITAGKNLLEAGLRNIVIYEKGDQVGGNWIFSPRLSHSSVFETTHIISSRRMSAYFDYPMPDDYPDYPSHKQLLAYFQGYADHFGVTENIRFNTEVVKVEKTADESWRLTLGDGSVEIFDYVLVANGHHWHPRLPDYPGEFTGQFMHSHDFKSAAPFKDQRVLVIGGGNSACDIAVETGRVSAFTAISMRRGYYIAPKFTMGQPTDVVNARLNFLPTRLRILFLRIGLYLSVGDLADYGLERPKHGVIQQHATVNSELLYFIRHGKIHPRKDIARFEGKTVHFVDGKAEDYDVVIAATGFKITFPFFDPDFIDYSEGDVPLYLRIFHPDHRNLFFIGLVQPLGALWPLSDIQSKLAIQAIIGKYSPPPDIRQQIATEVEGRRRHYLNTARHTIEVDYHQYLSSLEREMPNGAV